MTASKRAKSRKKAKKMRLRPWVKIFMPLLALLIIAMIVVTALSHLKSSPMDPLNSLYEDMICPRDYSEYVQKYAEEYGVEENLIYAVIKTESGFQPNAVSENNAKGLMQITEETFDWLSMKQGLTGQYVHDDLFNPELAIQYGSFFLSYLIDEFGTYTEVLAAYHAGRGAVNSWLVDPAYSADGKTLLSIPYADTTHYVSKVFGWYNKYVSLYGAGNKDDIETTS